MNHILNYQTLRPRLLWRTQDVQKGYQQQNVRWAGWQRVNVSVSSNKTNNATTAPIYVYSAFYDVRFQQPTVRIMALVPRKPSIEQIWCVVFVPRSEPVSTLLMKATIKISE
jgi:hypothetical protein